MGEEVRACRSRSSLTIAESKMERSLMTSSRLMSQRGSSMTASKQYSTVIPIRAQFSATVFGRLLWSKSKVIVQKMPVPMWLWLEAV